MTDEVTQQNLEKTGKGNGEGSKQTRFKPGFDKRRWLNGRGKKSPEQKEGEEILLAVYWKELSREFDPVTGKPLTPDEEPLTALEIAARKEIKTKFNNVVERVAGKVTDRLDLSNKDGSLKIIIQKASDGSHSNDQ